ncbi:MAG: hypothetical protein PHD84_10590 [Atribacterota bacterium]|nr:hypothetical protein [Atribacterota bacterium]
MEELKSRKVKKEKKYSIEYLKSAHKHSIFHKKEIMESRLCGCFHCLQTFYPDEIFNWCDEDNPKGATALCPFCYVDAVIGSKSGFPVDDPEFLEEMQRHWFG